MVDVAASTQQEEDSMVVSVTRGFRWKVIAAVLVSIVVGLPTSWSGETGEEVAAERAMAAYDELAAVVEAKDVEAFKALMSAGLTERMTADWMIAQGVLSGPKYFEKVPRAEPQIDGTKAVFSETYDEETVIATHAIEFVNENGGWKFDGYRTTTKSK